MICLIKLNNMNGVFVWEMIFKVEKSDLPFVDLYD